MQTFKMHVINVQAMHIYIILSIHYYLLLIIHFNQDNDLLDLNIATFRNNILYYISVICTYR